MATIVLLIIVAYTCALVLMDVDSRLLGKPPVFTGKDSDWADWCFSTQAYLETLGDGVADCIKTVLEQNRLLSLAGMRAGSQADAREIYFVLIMILKGPPLLLLRQVEKGNGYEAWRRLHDRYESQASARVAALLGQVLRPAAFPAEASAFETALQEWELQVTKWESIAEDLLNDGVKRQVLLDQAPSTIRTQLVLAGHTNYDDLRAALLSYMVSSKDWAAASKNGPAPMDISALTPQRSTGPKCWACGQLGHYESDWPHMQGERQRGSQR